MADKPTNKPSVVTKLPTATYRADIPTSLRNLAEAYETGEYTMPESLVIVTNSHDGVDLYAQGVQADNDIQTMGMLEIAKGLVIASRPTVKVT